MFETRFARRRLVGSLVVPPFFRGGFSPLSLHCDNQFIFPLPLSVKFPCSPTRPTSLGRCCLSRLPRPNIVGTHAILGGWCTPPSPWSTSALRVHRNICYYRVEVDALTSCTLLSHFDVCWKIGIMHGPSTSITQTVLIPISLEG